MDNVKVDRTRRTEETRAAEVRPTPWKPAHDLPVPDPIDGYEFRWIRVAMMGTRSEEHTSELQ